MMIRSALGALLLSSCLPAAAIPGLFNTGVDNAGVPLTGGDDVAELHWQQNGGTAFTFYQNPYIPETLTGVGSDQSRWLGPNGSIGPFGSFTIPFTLTFDLTGFDPDTASITGRWAADNCGTANLNGGGDFSTITTCSTSPSFTAWTAFTVNSGFQSGLNTLTFDLQNTSGFGAIRIEFLESNAEAVPEPAACALVGSGLLAAIALRRRRE